MNTFYAISLANECVCPATLAQAPNLAGLAYLDIRCAFGPEGARALAASPYLCQLKSLLLHGCCIGDEGAKALARSPVLATLEYLGLSSNNLTDEGARALAASPYLERLKKGGLEMGSSNFLTADGIQALHVRLGDPVQKLPPEPFSLPTDLNQIEDPGSAERPS